MNSGPAFAHRRNVMVSLAACFGLVVCRGVIGQQRSGEPSRQRVHSHGYKTPTKDLEFQYGLNIWTHKLKSSDGYAQWSTDGRALAVSFCEGNDKNRLLVWRRGKRVLDWNGSSFLAGEPIYKMAWSRDDRRLLIHIPPTEGSWDQHTGPLWCIDMATGKHRLICQPATYFSWIGSNTIRYRYKSWGPTGHPVGPDHVRVVRVH